MFNIQNYLGKFSKDIASQGENKKQILYIIKTHTSIDLAPENIEIKNYILNIEASPGTKNKIFIFKDKILEEVKLLLRELKISDIR